MRRSPVRTHSRSSCATRTGATDGYPVAVENCGRTLTFDRPPSRVVLGYHPLAEMFVGLGLADRAIGRAGFEGALDEAPLLRAQAAALEAIPVVSDGNYLPPREDLLGLRPDFVLAYGIFDFGGETAGRPGLATMAELEAAGVRSYMATCPDGPRDPGGGYGEDTLAATYRTILDLGTIFDVRPRAEARVAQMKQQIAAVRARVPGDPLKVFVYSRGTGPINAVGGTGLISELVLAAGGENVFSEQKAFFQTSPDAVAAKLADAVLVVAGRKPRTGPETTDEARFLLGASPDMPASRNRRVAVTGYEFTSPGWRIAQTAEDLARQLHPAAFGTPPCTFHGAGA